MIQKVRSSIIADVSITGNKIPSFAVSTNNIVAGSITGNLLSSNVITTNNIVEGSITNAKLAEPNALEDYFLFGLGS